MKHFIIGLINLVRRAEIDPWCIRLPAIARPRFIQVILVSSRGNVCKVKVRRYKVNEVVRRFCDSSNFTIFIIFVLHRPSTQPA